MKNIAIVWFMVFFGVLNAQNANDCTDAIVLCGDTPVGIEPSGVGFDEFSLPGNFQPPCYSFNNQTAWFKVEIDQGGSFTFDIVPENPNDDYDFAVYGPVQDCQNLGRAIRCSSTHPPSANVSADTGLNDTETDTSEGPGADGNGYLKAIDASPGETYYILIDRASGSAGFDINLTGSATTPKTTGYNTPEDFEICSTTGTNTYDLSIQRDLILQGYPDTRVSFHSELGDANLARNELPDVYTNTLDSEILYARIYSPLNSCSEIMPFKISVAASLVNDNPGSVFICDATINQNYNLLPLGNEIIRSRTDQQIRFYQSQQDRDTDQNTIQTLNLSSSQTAVFYRIESTNGDCLLLDEFIFFLTEPPAVLKPSALDVCVADENSLTLNLDQKANEALGGQDISLFSRRYYATANDRDLDQNRLSSNYTTEAVAQEIFMRIVANRSGCYSDTSFQVVFNESPVFEFPETAYYCTDTQEPVELSVASGFAYYEWSTGQEGIDLNTIFIDKPGEYSITVYNEAGCATTQTVQVLPSAKAIVETVEVTGLNYPNNEVSIQVSGSGDYEFSLDDAPFVDSSVFTGLSAGYHQLAIRDKNGCGTVETEPFLVLDYPRYFTPNGDGIHDTWQLIGLEEYPGAQIFIYDRYGKLLKQLQSSSEGWDGTFLGTLLNPDDYWFELQLPDGISIKGHFSLIY